MFLQFLSLQVFGWSKLLSFTESLESLRKKLKCTNAKFIFRRSIWGDRLKLYLLYLSTTGDLMICASHPLTHWKLSPDIWQSRYLFWRKVCLFFPRVPKQAQHSTCLPDFSVFIRSISLVIYGHRSSPNPTIPIYSHHDSMTPMEAIKSLLIWFTGKCASPVMALCFRWRRWQIWEPQRITMNKSLWVASKSVLFN